MRKNQSKSPTHRYERKNKSYDRRPGNRQPGRCFLIVCEGAITEPNYFDSLRRYLNLSTVKVKIKECAGAPISVVREAQLLVDARNKEIIRGRTSDPMYESVWCVFDVENPNCNPSFDQAIQTAKEKEFSLAVSNPAFEYWYLLHFEQTLRPFLNGVEIKDYLRRFIRGYTSSMSVFQMIVNRTRTAINNARNLLENHPIKGQSFPNPATQVYLLVEELINMSPTGQNIFEEKE